MKQEDNKRKLIRDQEGLDRLARQIKEVRKREGYTQERLAAEAGVALSQVARIETAQTNPTISTLFRFARAMEVPVSDLVDFKLPKKDFTD